jgi:hypothetical protein
MRSAYVIKIELNTKLISTDLEDNRVSINGLDKDKIFICENLTKHRYDMLKRLNTHRINNKVVRNLEDVDSLALGSLN